ncbi:MAG: hypothetical protein COX62_01730 [Deltaproteobacteria bacterium CG_4_10_14_0_2_um_filter_43_8]|nr:MAG: hypothetical protein COV43_08540 [Deltaproteobacteria bacterium CG11_big_fil_rev_8_21_14_0_20_42_23]PJA21666.1 MAG: hypothetical protein COX62_01730 [Deltaproteobacteria bacterium CG_4_10_14_0_2_um_filter_43_8]PJC64298.1 MAG: hypothetical protein CO021_04660 [Deltaproteobacteria bacterium CG_4_9_14_0_2_um_filter_42_21]
MGFSIKDIFVSPSKVQNGTSPQTRVTPEHQQHHDLARNQSSFISADNDDESNVRRAFSHISSGLNPAMKKAGGVTVNGIDYEQLVRRYSENPTLNAEKFLRGAKARLSSLLKPNSGANVKPGVKDAIAQQLESIDKALKHSPARVLHLSRAPRAV